MRATHLFLLLALLLAQVLCATQEVFVSPNGSDVDGDGSEDKPYQTFGAVFNSSTDPTDSLKIYVYPGTYGGVNNTNFNYTGPLTIQWTANSTAEEGANSITIDCTAAGGVTCFTSNTSITINGLDGDNNPQFIFNDCGTCLSVDNSGGDNENDDYFITISGATFDSVTQVAVAGYSLKEVTISDTIFTDTLQGGAGLSLVYLSNIDDSIMFSNVNFTSLNKNALTILNTTSAEFDLCNWSNAKVAITGVDPEESHVIFDNNTFTDGPGAVAYTVSLSTGIFTIKDSKFSTMGTGSVQSSNSATTSIINTSFELAQAQEGGALYFENVTTVTVSENCYFYQNGATTFGGAIFLNNSEAHFDSSNFTQNSARTGAAIGCVANSTVVYDNTTVFFNGNVNTDAVNATDIQNTCNVEISTFQSSLVVSSDDDGSDAWIWILVSIAILVVILIIVAAVGFVIYQRKRQSYTRMD